jgi:hypothetical protein
MGLRMTETRQQDEKMLLGHPPEILMDLFFAHIRNIWRVDGLYFLGIEEKLGTDFATEIDAGCHKILGRIEAKILPSLLGLKGRGLPELVTAVKHSCWYLDLLEKTIELEEGRAVLTVNVCGTQLTRVGKGLKVFPCKQVRQGYLEAFIKAFNRDMQCTCLFCPPDERPKDAWCRWEFTYR